ncbi:hypothetical protein J6W34_01200 [bacterium]|nr:hypothetical protein [bacterium]
MKTFKQFLAENIYPGGYYDMHGNLQVHFDNAEEKKKFDDDPRNDTRSDDWHYENDKSHENNVKTFKKLHSIAGKVDKGITNTVKGLSSVSNDFINHINNEVFGDSKITDIAVDKIKDINSLNKEIESNRDIILKIDKMIKQAKTNEHKKYLKDLRIKRVLRQRDLLQKKKEYEDKYYN